MKWLLSFVAVLPLVGGELPLDVISYEDLIARNECAMECLRSALYEKGIVAVSGIPGYSEKLDRFVQISREFSSLPDDVKDLCTPDRDSGAWMGYEHGKEKFFRDGVWVVDDKKHSYYARVPDCEENLWPAGVDLQGAFQDLGALMVDVGIEMMNAVDLLGDATGISMEGAHHVARMLHYEKSFDSGAVNPYWCGAHFDHSIFTALIPSSYFQDGEEIDEPEEAGLFVRTGEKEFLKVRSNKDVMMFQVGEFAQLVTNDAIRATEHRVHKANGTVDRYAMALFFHTPDETVIHSTSVLTKDARYGSEPDGSCTYYDWEQRTLDRFRNK